MKTRNLNYYYYVDYFNDLDMQNPDKCEDKLLKHNKQLTDFKATDAELMPILDKSIAPHTIELQTMYPGMLIGTGIAHSFGGKGEAELGLCLDYTTGMPYIPGSSVKGVLRSAFVHQDYISSLLEDIGIKNVKDIDISELEARIFGNSIDKKKKQYSVSIQEQDKFYDAVVVSAGKLLATDAITSHRQDPELLELAAPNPITMIRIRPDIRLVFQFSLKSTLGVTTQQKIELFKHILLDMGIGAKTNVGYGLLIEPEDAIKLKDVQNCEEPKKKEQDGFCKVCGKPTSINKKTGKYYQFCGICVNKQ